MHRYFILRSYDLLSVITIFIFIIIDQLIKSWATTYLAPIKTMEVLPGIVQFRYVLNDGAAFGLFGGSKFFLITLTSLGLLALLYFIFFKKGTNKFEKFSLIMVFSGGVGNLINRITSGYVVDYIDPVFINFAVFNFADCLVCIGVFFLVVHVFLQDYHDKKKEE